MFSNWLADVPVVDLFEILFVWSIGRCLQCADDQIIESCMSSLFGCLICMICWEAFIVLLWKRLLLFLHIIFQYLTPTFHHIS